MRRACAQVWNSCVFSSHRPQLFHRNIHCESTGHSPNYLQPLIFSFDTGIANCSPYPNLDWGRNALLPSSERNTTRDEP